MNTMVQAELGMQSGTDEFTGLVRAYKLRAFHFALQLVGHSEDALDLTQEAFLRVHRHWHRRDRSRPFAPWFYSILRNLAIDLLRKRASLREEGIDAARGAFAGPGPEILAERSELKCRVWEAITLLPQAQRETVILRDLHGLSYGEIAEILGVPVTTVTSRLHDGRERLRKKLERYL
jgi:RNA polymerase sigma-70 factor (ECF subfamily)